MSKMNALEMLKLIFMITHKKKFSVSALSEHKLFIFKFFTYYTTSIKMNFQNLLNISLSI